MATNAFVRRALLAALVLGLSGCTFFARKPPLPKHAAIERPGSAAAATDYRWLVDQADVIYFPEERAASGAKTEPAALLLEAVQQSAKPFAVAWDLIDATQQTALDELQADGAPREELIRKLELSGTGRAREHCRAVLRELRAHVVALRLPQPLLEKIAQGRGLTSDEQALLPTGYKMPGGGYEAYAESLGGRGSSAAEYRAEVIQRQFAAETIVRYFRATGSDAKLIVFARAADFADDKGVPYYVAQKMNLRQLVLGRENPEPRGSLLALFPGHLRRGFQVVDGAPWASHD